MFKDRCLAGRTALVTGMDPEAVKPMIAAMRDAARAGKKRGAKG